MGLPVVDPLRVFVLVCLLIPVAYLAGEGYITWFLTREWIFYFNSRDYYTAAFCLLPIILGHIATIWGHYFRAEREFQHSITKVTTPVSVKQKISLWEHHIFLGYTVKYWILVAIIVLLNCGWVVSADLPYAEEELEDGILGGVGLLIGQAGGYGAIASCGIILFLVLRRSMLHALGFTYSEILPLHRWLGVLIVFWSVIHTIGYVIYYAWDHSLSEAFNFYDTGRATMNIMGCIALGALLILAVFSIPQVRRRFYTVFMTLHRVMTVVFFVATVVHYPYYMLWYYLLPSIVLFFVDRFIPKTIQARTLYPESTCTLNADADIVKMTITSPEPMKPYYPGDYIMVQVPELGTLYHPFTIASYWPEDPRSIVLFIRTYNENPRSWTGAMARLCGAEDKRVRIKTNVDGVFGDRRHDYLKSEVLVVFVAGAAITTFMALIKAIAAQIAASSDPLRMQFHLICTFRTRSELHAYGSFLHQITRDPRFTSWLHVEIYVSRPDKPKTLIGPHAHVIKNDIMVPGQSAPKSKKKKRFQSLRRTGTKLKRALSGRTVVGSAASGEKQTFKVESAASSEKQTSKVESEAATVRFSTVSQHVRSESSDTVIDSEKDKDSSQEVSGSSSEDHACSSPTTLPSSPVSIIAPKFDIIETQTRTDLAPPSPTRTITYHTKSLPTFQDAQSASVATRFAKLDLHTMVILIVVPLAFWFGLRAVHWEGSPHYCDVMEDMGPTGDKICYGSYSMAPPVGHAILVALIGYFSMWLARRNLVRSLAAANKHDIESGKHHSSKNLPYPELDMEEDKLSVEDGNWDEGDVVYSTGRMNVKMVIERFMTNGVGSSGNDRGLVTVFGGGPEAFVEHVERQIKTAKWAVDFHRETWAP
ncbi:ferric reductase like transmembrane component-domain-containing protein [Mortierella sp. GBAus27b]|nr:hypothetical protein BGX31_002124 [Mortierella sp. GBA43]KAI8358733.1 ferric reductase like transmembrane component-domain-containing protein [Mortierella sp. GBAus27b]